MPVDLIVTVDTEEEGLWSGTFRTQHNTVSNIQQVPRFQQLCDHFEIRPSYLVDWPVLEDDAAVRVLDGIQQSGCCEIGAHLHPWCTPPLDGAVTSRDTYMCNLPEASQRDKLAALTDRVQQRFGHRPTSFRAGRYGLDATGARLLADLGYTVDSSVLPFTDYSAEGGPDFRDAPWRPYYVNGNDIAAAHDDGPLLEVPVSVGFSRADFASAASWRSWAERPWPRRLRMVGVLDRLGVAKRIKFSPEQASLSEMKKLVNALCAQNAPAAVMMFHSSSLLPGATPYVSDETALDRFLNRIHSIFEYCTAQRGFVSRTLTEFASRCG